MLIRSFNSEDIDYIVNSHYEIYNREYSYDFFPRFHYRKCEGITLDE